MIKTAWLQNAYYSTKYVTDGILILDRSKIWVPDGYRPLRNKDSIIDKLFNLSVHKIINTQNKVNRTYAKTTINRYSFNNQYVTINDEYSYLFKHNKLYTLQECKDKQYLGPLALVNNYGLFGIISPIEVQNIEDKNFWIDVDKIIGITK